ncbi:MAG: hypothetical protein ACREOS_05980 [Candidatus Dormibacteraceae bacterium]
MRSSVAPGWQHVGRSSARRLALVGLASLILLAPWIVRLWAAHHQQVVSTWRWQPIDFPLDLATAGNDRWVLIVALVGLAAAFLWRPALAVLLTTWWVLAVVIANPATFHLPVNLFLDGSSLAIALFVPAAILVGFLVDLLAGLLHHGDWPVVWRWLSAGLLLLAGLTQAPSLTAVVNPCCLLIRPGDVGAIEWVRAHTPPDARFVINGYRWMDQIWMGTDAGYWLPVLAHRPTSLPPLFYGVGPRGQVEQVNQTAASVEADAADPAALARLADQIGARYVFIGSRGGPLDPAVLERSRRFRVDYHGGGAWVF